MQTKSLRIHRWCRVLAVILAVLICVPACAATAFAAGSGYEAVDIIRQCTVTASKCLGFDYYLWNNNYVYAFIINGSGEQYLRCRLNGREASGIYIRWDLDVPEWTLEATLKDGSKVTQQCGQYGFLQEYVPLPEDTTEFKMITSDGSTAPLKIVELEVLSAGTLPASVHTWQPTPSSAELLFVSTHQDDEILFFGGGIPYYAGELQYDTIVAYTAGSNPNRLHEALDGLWVCGNTQHPIFLLNYDTRCWSLDEALNFWDRDEITEQLTEVILKYRPQVVVTQDEKGEYGHGQHILTVECVKEALDTSMSETYIAEHFDGQYQPWTVQKCYLHLYAQNNISMPWDELPLEYAGGKTAFEVAQEAFLCHVSQQNAGFFVSTDPKAYDCRSFGLFRTQVGPDVEKNDFFENVALRYYHVQPNYSDVPNYFELVEPSSGWLYRNTNAIGTAEEYLRYCEVNGHSGWFIADYTGALTEPITEWYYIKDNFALDLSAYETLKQVSDTMSLYEYNDGLTLSSLYVRYCSVSSSGQSAFYLAKEDGSLELPLTEVSVSMYKTSPTTAPVQDVEEEEDPSSKSPLSTDSTLLIICCVVVAAALIMSVAVIQLSISKSHRRY